VASGPNWNPRRGTYWVQWWDGHRWRRTTVTKRPAKWKPGDPEPKKVPSEALAGYTKYSDKEREARESRPSNPEQTVAAFLASCRETYVGRQPGSAVELGKACDVFLAWCKRRGLSRLSEVTPEACAEWVRHRAQTTSKRTGKPIAHATLKKERGLLSGVWGDGVTVGAVRVNPWKTATIPGKAPKTDRGSWTPEQFERLIAVSAPWLRDILLVGCHTGLRIEALIGLEWRDVKWDKGDQKGFGFVVVRHELDKTHKGYQVPIDRVCHDVLARRFVHKDAHASRVLTGKSGKPLRRSSHTDTAIRRACKRAGLKNPDSANHHMRRTFGRWAVLGHLTGRPVPMYVVSKWMGHSTVAMTEAYLHVNLDDSARWMEEYIPERQDGNASLGHDPVST
jgi:integrase